jgi:predicted RNase H-like nuclease
MTVVGLDRSRGRWAAVAVDGARCEIDLLGSAAEVRTCWPDVRVVAVDIPIGLPVDRIGRQVDAEARRLLGPRGSSVFPALPAELYRMPYGEALEVSRRRHGVGFSKQAWQLGPAVLDVAAVAGQGWIEAHPELAFLRLSGGPLPPKRTWSGLAARLRLLAGEGVELPVAEVEAPADDVVDAAVCSLVAGRFLAGVADSIPPEPKPGDPIIWS